MGAASALNEEASVFLTVHRGVKKRGRRGNEMNWSRRKGVGWVGVEGRATGRVQLCTLP